MLSFLGSSHDQAYAENGRRRLPIGDIAVAAAAAVYLLATFPFLYMPSATPRLAAILCLLPLGAALLCRDVRDRDRAATAAVAVSVWIVASSALSAAPGVALLGAYGRETSALIYVGSIAGWAIARRLSSGGLQYFNVVLLGALVVTALVGFLQLAVRSGSWILFLVDGRAFGLSSGPIYFGAVTAGGAAYVCARGLRSRIAFPLVVLFAAAANLSGSRFPVAVGFVTICALAAHRRAWVQLVGSAGAYLAGVVTSSWVSSLLGDATTATGRATSEAAGRLDAWRYGAQAIGDKPVFGWGAGNFRPAVQGRFSAEFSARHASQELSQIWFDAHNILVGLAVSFGVVGLLLCVAFAWFATRHASGPLLVFTAVVGVTWLLEPTGLVTLPLALLTLGASQASNEASGVIERSEPTRVSPDSMSRLLVLGGLTLALLFVLIDVQLSSAVRSQRPEEVARAARWTPWDPVAANVVAAAYVNFVGDVAAHRSAAVWLERARDRQPDWPFYYNKIAEVRLTLGDNLGARRSLEDALALQPWNAQSLDLMRIVAERTGDGELRDSTDLALCRLGVTGCD